MAFIQYPAQEGGVLMVKQWQLIEWPDSIPTQEGVRGSVPVNVCRLRRFMVITKPRAALFAGKQVQIEMYYGSRVWLLTDLR